MARMIDGDKLVENLRLIATCWSISPYVSKEKHNGAVDMLREVEREVKEAPTLTQPNEPRMINADKLAKRIAGHSNYHGDSILAAIYCAAEGKENDAPIRPLETPPNEPLTLDELREMDGDPVWVDDENNKRNWALLQVWGDENIDAVFLMPGGCFHAESVIGKKIYRRPPERQEDT